MIIVIVTLSRNIKEKALELGFHKIGIVRAEALRPEGDRLLRWLAEGMHGEMLWMNREPVKRVDPRNIFPAARSIVVVAHNYFTPHDYKDDPAGGKISRYAWGDDYHDILREKLRSLLAWIVEQMPEAEGKICVDTAPAMDKAWAVRAGLGWLGKHSNVITKDYGSWIFIGELLLNIELDYDNEIIPDHCGSCTACLDACPTKAIIEPYVVDSRKCISYATIELHDDSLPKDIADNLNGWFYGCDICQDVCPWNRFEKPTEESRFEPRKNETSIGLNEVSKFSPEEYAERFRKSAIKHAKLPALKRNANTLIGNTEK